MIVTQPLARPMSAKERRTKYAQSEHGSAKRRAYRKNGRGQSIAHYQSRPFRSFDGEGVTVEDGSHKYTLLATACEGRYQHIKSTQGLTTDECLGFLTDVATRDKQRYRAAEDAGESLESGLPINVIFGGSYDFNMMLGDFTESELQALYTHEFYTWRYRYRISWRRGKSFYVVRVDYTGKPVGSSITLYDTASFFQTTFVKACDDYLGTEWADRDMIKAMKDKRGSFTDQDEAEVLRYCYRELDLLIELMSELRSRLDKVHLRPRRWDGPGAVAATLLVREKIKLAMDQPPDSVRRASRYAYAGGRFEIIKYGGGLDPCFEADINSAYPYAFQFLPNLKRGRWVHHDGYVKAHFALYHVAWFAYFPKFPGPLPYRDSKGSIHYPQRGASWVWSPEIEAALDYETVGLGRIKVTECWVFEEDDPSDRPFAFIEPLFNKRKALKRGGDGAHVGIKLALNSLYGKTAQQLGFKIGRNGQVRLPTFHQLEWAGYATSYVRAMILRAINEHPESIIQIATDAVFSTDKLDLDYGENLGQWEAIPLERLTVASSGIYFGPDVVRTRGVDKGMLSEEQAIETMKSPTQDERRVPVTLTRFVTAGTALQGRFDHWRRWEQFQKIIKLYPTGKRGHIPEVCGCNRWAAEFNVMAWHTTVCPLSFLGDGPTEHSSQFTVEWELESPRLPAKLESKADGIEYDV